MLLSWVPELQCSVGLNLDLGSFPQDENLTPQEEFQSFLSRFPTIAAHFENPRSCTSPYKVRKA